MCSAHWKQSSWENVKMEQFDISIFVKEEGGRMEGTSDGDVHDPYVIIVMTQL